MQIFRAGTRPDASGERVTITSEDLAKTAAAYDVNLHEAPIVVGHPKHDDPAYGWVKALSTVGENLEALPQQLEASFCELLNAGRFKKISASFYKPDSPINPVPGVYYLKHVGFLGAMPPAVKGLKQYAFSEEGGDTVTFDFGEGGDDERGSGRLSPEELQRREAAVAAREAALGRQEFASFAQGLLNDGKQFNKSLAIELYSGLGESGELEFAEEGETKKLAPREAFKLFLSKLPKSVEFGEVAGGEVPQPETDPAKVAARISKYHAEQKGAVSFAEAAAYVSAHPEYV